MTSKFTKADLRDGMIVELRKEGKYIVIKNMLLDDDGAIELEEYDDDMLFIDREEDDAWDIMAVYEFDSYGNYPSILNVLKGYKYLNLLWEREEVKYMTVDEMRQKLKELTGDNIEIAGNCCKH